MSSWFRPLGTLSGPDAGDVVVLTPEAAGWQYSGLQVLDLEPGVPRTIPTGPSEFFVLPVSGSLGVRVRNLARPGLDVEASFVLRGRTSVFEAASDFAYVGRDSQLTLTSPGGARVALPNARCENRFEPRYGPVDAVPVEVRGAGPATRYVRNFGTPGVWDHAEKLIACELITPPGNWSSYPPHKHDVTHPCQVANEEIYWFRIAGADQITPGPEGFGLHGTSTGPEHEEAGLEPIHETVAVRDGDSYLIPYGYHGPCVAAPGYPMYYLNVLAGPGPQRSMAFCDDPAHAWVRDTWSD